MELYRYQAENYKRRIEKLKEEKDTLEVAFSMSKKQLENSKMGTGQTNSQKFFTFLSGAKNQNQAIAQSQATIKKLNSKVL